MFKKITYWLRTRHERRVNAIAKAVVAKIDAAGHGEYLPPVVLRDKIYFTTKRGAIYVIKEDMSTEQAIVFKIQDRRGL